MSTWTLQTSELRTAVAELIGDSASGLVVFHTDITTLGIPAGAKNRQDALQQYAGALESACASRALVFPTFNYDFCRGGVYDVSADRCQVGALNEYYRLQRSQIRTTTPVFNFCCSHRDALPRDGSANPFDDGSTFAELRRRAASVVFLGAPFSANTFIHHVEELANAGYRYLKPFPGVVIDGERRLEMTLRYRVRPLREDVVDYDWPRLIADLREEKILRTRILGRAELLAYDAQLLAAYWLERLTETELYLLTPQSRDAVRRLGEEVGYPFAYETLEGPISTSSKHSRQ